MILPHNYLLSDPSRQATQQIRIDYNVNSTTDVYSWASQAATGELDFVSIHHSYIGMWLRKLICDESLKSLGTLTLTTVMFPFANSLMTVSRSFNLPFLDFVNQSISLFSPKSIQ